MKGQLEQHQTLQTPIPRLRIQALLETARVIPMDLQVKTPVPLYSREQLAQGADKAEKEYRVEADPILRVILRVEQQVHITGLCVGVKGKKEGRAA
ncbi:MAG: hypothetical protein ACREIQ_09605 [Nitrospiria bacterium]